MATTLLSLIALKLLEEYCKQKNHKKLRYLIAIARRIISWSDGGLLDSSIEIIFNALKSLN